ncbi:Protease 2 [compost metagenome]
MRGGGELGEAWYRAGKLEHKQNTFGDFIACAEHLCAEGYSTPAQLAISGGSAGGLLIGAVLNQRPRLFAAAIAEVPFVDVLNTMLDPELPLTVTEYDEWGNPQEPEVHERIRGYAPYENVCAQDYPALLVVAGYNDTRVQYWEAAKWVAKLRASKTDNHLLLLKTDLGAGHGGMSGRYQGLKDVALEYAFLLKVLGLAG